MTNYQNLEFNERLKVLRKERGFTQGELAALAGLTSPAISQLESGIRYPSFESAKKLAKGLNVSLDLLCLGKEIISLESLDPRIVEIIENFHKLPKKSQEQLYRLYQGLKNTQEENSAENIE